MICMLLTMADSPEDKRKIEQLYEKYNRLMFSVALNILHHAEDAEDAVFHSWEKIIKNIDKINEIGCKETQSFIVIITERTSIDHYRKRKNRLEVPVEEYENSPYAITREQKFTEIETIEWIRNLPKTYSEVLILHYIHNMSVSDIAKLLSLKESAVSTRLHRGRKMLAELGGDRHDR